MAYLEWIFHRTILTTIVQAQQQQVQQDQQAQQTQQNQQQVQQNQQGAQGQDQPQIILSQLLEVQDSRNAAQ
ncbi:hypothetical protein K449DRAFT_435340 [Hypoxylon sp. EC38]|nr:hypothetical protein K449DRAFT_435340 [Hypoxylon sp. EC38]